MSPVYIALLHYPVYNKRKEVVSTCITGFDLHDIARTAMTYGIKKYFVVNPMPAQQQFAARIIDFWMDETSLEFNWTRAEAFKRISIKAALDEVIDEVTKGEGRRPKIIATSAKPRETVTFEKMKAEIREAEKPYLILFGTGWGMTEDFFQTVDATLEPVLGPSDYNHLPVRSAVAIILDRLLGC